MRFDLKNPYKKQSAIEYFDKLIEKESFIELRTIQKKRTVDQNSLYWLWLACIERETGNAKDIMHLLYRANFLCVPDEKIIKIIIPGLWEKCKIRINCFDYFKGLEDIISIISKSTTGLDKAEMAAYLDRIKDHANQTFDIRLMTLEEKGFDDFYNEYFKYQ